MLRYVEYRGATCLKLINIDRLIPTAGQPLEASQRPRAIIVLRLESVLQYARERAGTDVVGALKCGLFA